MNDDDMNMYNEWLDNPMLQSPFCTPFIVKERIVKEGDYYVLKKVVCNPIDVFCKGVLPDGESHE